MKKLGWSFWVAALLMVFPSLLIAIERANLSSIGVQGNQSTYSFSISSDGRFIAFESDATNLVSNDYNSTGDIFVRDQQTGQTSIVSVNSSGVQGNNYSQSPAISGDGRYVAFASTATNLVSGDTNGVKDIFVHDRQTGQTTRVSVDSFGVQSNGVSSGTSISNDGRYVAFQSSASNLVPADTNSAMDVFVHDIQTGYTKRVSVSSTGVQGNSASGYSKISSDGQVVVYSSAASNLVSNDTNNREDIFIHIPSSSQTFRVSVNSAGVQQNGTNDIYIMGPGISGNGRFIVFESNATNLGGTAGDAYIHDRQTGTTTRINITQLGEDANLSLSDDGRYLAFTSSAINLVSGDTNGFADVWRAEES
jgi:dipeptidyl aminopeptidase/acylaminoacyl peptidase